MVDYTKMYFYSLFAWFTPVVLCFWHLDIFIIVHLNVSISIALRTYCHKYLSWRGNVCSRVKIWKHDLWFYIWIMTMHDVCPTGTKLIRTSKFKFVEYIKYGDVCVCLFFSISHDFKLSSIKNICIQSWEITVDPRETSDISRTLVGDKIVDHSDVVGTSPVDAAPTTPSLLT